MNDGCTFLVRWFSWNAPLRRLISRLWPLLTGQLHQKTHQLRKSNPISSLNQCLSRKTCPACTPPVSRPIGPHLRSPSIQYRSLNQINQCQQIVIRTYIKQLRVSITHLAGMDGVWGGCMPSQVPCLFPGSQLWVRL